MTPYVRSLSSALSIAGRSIFILVTLVCSVHTCDGLASSTLTPTTVGMQLKTPQGKIVFEYKTKIPAILQSPSAAYFDPVDSPSGEQVSNAAPDDHPWHRGIFLGILNSEFRTPVDPSKLSPNHLEGAFNVKRADFWAWGLYAPRDNRIIKNRDIQLINADEKHAELEIRNGQRNTARAAYGTQPSGISTPVLTIRAYSRFTPAAFVGLWVWWMRISLRGFFPESLIREAVAQHNASFRVVGLKV